MKLLFFPKLECVCTDISYTHTAALLQFGLVSSDSTVKRKQRESHTWSCQLLWNQTCVKHSLRRRWDVGGARVYLWVQSKCGHIFDPSWRGEPLPSSEKSSSWAATQRRSLAADRDLSLSAEASSYPVNQQPASNPALRGARQLGRDAGCVMRTRRSLAGFPPHQAQNKGGAQSARLL